MLKMFSTQVAGLFKRISEREELAIEDGARLLAQAAAGEGSIYIYGINEMSAIQFEAENGQEILTSAKAADSINVLSLVSDADRALIVSRFSTDPEAVAAARLLVEKGISFVGISTVILDSDDDLSSLADVHINLGLTKGLLPDDQGGRVGFPTSMAALFVYYALRFTIDEILEEYE